MQLWLSVVLVAAAHVCSISLPQSIPGNARYPSICTAGLYMCCRAAQRPRSSSNAPSGTPGLLSVPGLTRSQFRMGGTTSLKTSSSIATAAASATAAAAAAASSTINSKSSLEQERGVPAGLTLLVVMCRDESERGAARRGVAWRGDVSC